MDIYKIADLRTAIWGAAREGLAITKKLLRINPQGRILIFNDQEITPEQQKDFNDLNVQFVTGKQIGSHLNEIDVLIKSPGVSFYRREIQQLLRQGTLVTSGTNLWLSQHRDKKILAITGSKGKSTTTSICTEILKAEGLNAVSGGNIGKPLWDLSDDHDYYVLELSSYQITDLSENLSAALLLNLYPAHQIWHGSEERYYQDKARIQNFTDNFVINAQDQKVKSYISKTDLIFYNHQDTFSLIGNQILKNGSNWFDCRQMQILGAHNYLNTCAALTLAALFTDLSEKSKNALCTFQAISHRLEKAGCFNGINFINDSIATVPESVIAAIKAVESCNLTLLIGGQDIEGNWTAFYEFLSAHPVQNIITLPDNGRKIHAGFNVYLKNNNLTYKANIYDAEDFNQAIETAKKITPFGGTVLLSPGTPSYGRFKNFEERGNLFKMLANS